LTYIHYSVYFTRLHITKNSGGAVQLVERRACNREVAKPWLDSRCGSASLYPWERHLMLFPTLGPKQSTRCGGSGWQKTCKQKSFCMTNTAHSTRSDSNKEDGRYRACVSNQRRL